jgi:hypothetical protein
MNYPRPTFFMRKVANRTKAVDPDILRYRREAERRKPIIAAVEKELLKEAKATYKEANKPWRPGRPRSIKVGKKDTEAY